jgi:putative colanic acid biosynthesis UDP-glucose lipid carrier transferase
MNKPLLQRRHTISSTAQAILDGMWIIALTYGLSIFQFKHLPSIYLTLCIVLLVLMGIVYDRSGVYRYNGSLTQKSMLLFKAWSITFGILLTIAFISKTSTLYSRQFLIIFFIVGYLGQLLLHIISRYYLIWKKSTQHDINALIIGTGELANYLFAKINNNPWVIEKIIGTVTTPDDSPKHDDNVVNNVKVKAPILGNLDDAYQLVDKHSIKVVYIVAPLNISPQIEKLYFELLDKNVDVHWVPNIFALHLINHSVKELAGIPIITLSETPLRGLSLVLKVLEDRILSVFILILISPILLIAAIAIKLDSPGPVFFRQERTGWDGTIFRIWKFRTMKVHREDNGVVTQATQDDPRVTRVGKFLRRTSIDELPQIFNVLQGSMSLVGPRPHAISHNIQYAKEIAAYLTRHRIKPGITGLAQVRGYRGETKDLELMIKRVKSDIEYINKWSISLDIIILLRTFLIFFKHNAY